MKKIILVLAVLSLIGCKKETLEPKVVYVDSNPDQTHPIYFIGEFDGEEINYLTYTDFNYVVPELLNGNFESAVCYKEQLRLGFCHDTSFMMRLDFIFLKNFNSTDINCDDKQSMYNIGYKPFGNVYNQKDGFVIRYTDKNGKLWSSEYLDQKRDAYCSLYENRMNDDYMEDFTKLFIKLYFRCYLYDSQGDSIEINGELSTLALKCYE